MCSHPDAHLGSGNDPDVATRPNYRGKRWDLRGGHDEDYEGPSPPDRSDLERAALRILERQGFYGIICSELAEYVGVTKEWMRRVLLDMERRGLCGHRRVGVKTRLWYSREMWDKYHERWPQ